MTNIPKDVLDEMRARTPLSTIFPQLAGDAHRDIRLIKKGKSFVCLCPFHTEKTPSFHVIDTKGIFHCFGCGESGDAFKLAQKFGLADNFPACVCYIAEVTHTEDLIRPYMAQARSQRKRLGIELAEAEFTLDTPDRDTLLCVVGFTQDYFVEQLHTNTSSGAILAREYLAGRGIHSGFAERLRLGYAPNHDLLLLRMQEHFSDFSSAQLYDFARRVGLYTGQNRRVDRKSTRLNSSHSDRSRMPSSA